MPLLPGSSRLQLNWKVFDQVEDTGEYKLVLPSYYSRLFEASFPSLVKKTRVGFRESASGKTRIATFPNLDEQDVGKIRGFLNWYGRIVCLSTNEHLQDSFSEELDFCLALAYAGQHRVRAELRSGNGSTKPSTTVMLTRSRGWPGSCPALLRCCRVRKFRSLDS